MCCKDSSNVIRQYDNICVYYLTFVRISHIKTTLETTRKHKSLAAALLEIIQVFTHNQKAITHFLQHPFVKENFVKIVEVNVKVRAKQSSAQHKTVKFTYLFIFPICLRAFQFLFSTPQFSFAIFHSACSLIHIDFPKTDERREYL